MLRAWSSGSLEKAGMSFAACRNATKDSTGNSSFGIWPLSGQSELSRAVRPADL
jgi:hypothetical protein